VVRGVYATVPPGVDAGRYRPDRYLVAVSVRQRRLLRLTAAEREFSRRIQEGDLRPELLFPRDARMVARLRAHPVLLWKVQNARERRLR